MELNSNKVSIYERSLIGVEKLNKTWMGKPEIEIIVWHQREGRAANLNSAKGRDALYVQSRSHLLLALSPLPANGQMPLCKSTQKPRLVAE